MDRIVLGVYDGPGGGAALVRGGELLAVAEEDRVRRHRVSGVPRASVQSVLRETGLEPETVSAVVLATRNATYSEGAGDAARPPLLYRVGVSAPAPPAIGRRIRRSFARSRRRRIDEALRSEFGISCPILFLDHHLMHAMTAVALTGRMQGLVLTMDAGADGKWAQISQVEAGRPRRISSLPGDASLLRFLGEIGQGLGLGDGPDCHARLETLASRGTPKFAERLDRAARVRDGQLQLDGDLFRRGLAAELLQTAPREDVASSALRFAGSAAARFAEMWSAKTGAEELLLSGDLFDLPTVVRAVRDAAVPRVTVPTAPGDSGLAIGCAFSGTLPGVLGTPDLSPSRLPTTPFLATEYPDRYIVDVLDHERAEYRLEPRIDRDVARVLAEGRTVARFSGRSEVGKRGLGNRAILRSPRGELRRGRAGFLIGPAAYHALLPAEVFAEWFEDEDPARFRFVPGFARALDRFGSECPALVHPSGHTLVQTVDAATMPRLHEMLCEFETWTGLPVLAVAPFRLPDEPLVASPLDALRTFRALGIDFAAIGSFLVANPDATRPPSSAESGAGEARR